MAAIGNKVAKEESRGDIIAVKIHSLEDTQKVLSESLVILVNGMKESKDDARKEALDSRKEASDSRKETSELKYMMRQLMNNNNSSNNRSTPQAQLTVNGGIGTQSNAFDNRITPRTIGTGTTKEKQKHDGTTPSSSPEEKELSSPDHRKQRHHSKELEIDPPNSTVPIDIDFGMYTNNIDMDIMDDTTTTLMRNEEDNNNDTEMGQVEETNNNASQRIGYIGSSGSFCSKTTYLDGTTTIIEEEEQSITGHNFDNTVNVMDYTIKTAPRTIRTTTQSNDGFTAVQNGSPNRNSIQERRESRVSNNSYSALQSSNTPSAKDRHDRKND
jgi:hypothetical protein